MKYWFHNLKVWLGIIKVGHYIRPGRVYVCRACKTRATYFSEHDMFACMKCDMWLESFPKDYPNEDSWFSDPLTSPKGEHLTEENAPWRLL